MRQRLLRACLPLRQACSLCIFLQSIATACPKCTGVCLPGGTAYRRKLHKVQKSKCSATGALFETGGLLTSTFFLQSGHFPRMRQSLLLSGAHVCGKERECSERNQPGHKRKRAQGKLIDLTKQTCRYLKGSCSIKYKRTDKAGELPTLKNNFQYFQLRR